MLNQATSITNQAPLTPLQQLKVIVADDLAKVDARALELIQSKAKLVPAISGYTIQAGGKRLRPLLTLVCSHMCNIQRNCHIDLALAVEFFHTATLLHDDVVDESKQRRGLSTANDVWGNKESILVGDYLLGKAFDLMGSAHSLEVYRILSQASVIIAEGEVLQLSATGAIDNAEAVYLEIIKAKTAELFAAACQIAPVMAEGTEEQIAALRTFGMQLGIAFQIIDDALDFSYHQKTLGKDIGDDFKERKVTLPVIYAYAQGNTEQKEFWQRTIAQGNQQQGDLETALAYIEEHHILEKVLRSAKEHAKPAFDALALFPDSPYKQALLDVVAFVVERKF